MLNSDMPQHKNVQVSVISDNWKWKNETQVRKLGFNRKRAKSILA